MSEKVLIIAEAGVNHNGSLETALQMATVAKECGADIVKFQTFKSDALVTGSARQAEYQKANTGRIESQRAMLKSLELDGVAHLAIRDHCVAIGIGFLSTAFDLESVDFLRGLGIRLWKVPSGELTNLPFLEKIASFSEPVLLSTGMATIEEVRASIDALVRGGLNLDDLTVLQCGTDYPLALEDVNLRVIPQYAATFGTRVGFSDHTLGTEAAVAAVALGAKVIEKHFTLDRMSHGPDHAASLEPAELARMVREIRNVEAALGSFHKFPSPAELKNREVARKSIVARVQIARGEVLSPVNLTTKRPGTGLSPMRWHEVLGSKAVRDFEPDELIEL